MDGSTAECLALDPPDSRLRRPSYFHCPASHPALYHVDFINSPEFSSLPPWLTARELPEAEVHSQRALSPALYLVLSFSPLRFLFLHGMSEDL